MLLPAVLAKRQEKLELDFYCQRQCKNIFFFGKKLRDWNVSSLGMCAKGNFLGILSSIDSRYTEFLGLNEIFHVSKVKNVRVMVGMLRDQT